MRATMFLSENCICNSSVDAEVVNYIGLTFKKVMPIVTLQGFTISGVGPRGFCWWTDGSTSVLVGRDASNMMLHGKFSEGMIITFPDRKRDGQVVLKFITLGNVNSIDKPKGI